jgi:hypothetical protein
MDEARARQLAEALAVGADELYGIALPASRSRKSLDGSGFYGNKFHAAVRKLTAVENLIMPVIESIPGFDPGPLKAHLATAKATTGSVRGRDTVRKKIRLICETAIVPRLAGLGKRAHEGALVSLRAHAAKLTNPDVRAFVEEAIGCAEEGFYRAAVVLSWVGAVAVLYHEVVAKDLAAFNAEALRRDPQQKWRDAKDANGLARMDEFQFLQVIEALSVIGKSVKHELEGCLKLRNGCGHPNSLKVADSKVAAHIETLVQNVFAVFS